MKEEVEPENFGLNNWTAPSILVEDNDADYWTHWEQLEELMELQTAQRYIDIHDDRLRRS